MLFKDVFFISYQVPGSEGRAGMAAIHDPEEKVDINEFYAAVKKTLPSYARPVFVRKVEKMDMTGELIFLDEFLWSLFFYLNLH